MSNVINTHKNYRFTLRLVDANTKKELVPSFIINRLEFKGTYGHDSDPTILIEMFDTEEDSPLDSLLSYFNSAFSAMNESELVEPSDVFSVDIEIKQHDQWGKVVRTMTSSRCLMVGMHLPAFSYDSDGPTVFSLELLVLDTLETQTPSKAT